MEVGYKVVRVHEVWHFDEVMQYDPQTKTGGLFTSYINAFLKLKQEASGWPKWCDTDLKIDYIIDYERREGIRLDPEAVVRNNGMRAVVKLMLNSFGGKFGQRQNMPRTTYIDDPKKFFNLLTDPSQAWNFTAATTANAVDALLLAELPFKKSPISRPVLPALFFLWPWCPFSFT